MIKSQRPCKSRKINSVQDLKIPKEKQQRSLKKTLLLTKEHIEHSIEKPIHIEEKVPAGPIQKPKRNTATMGKEKADHWASEAKNCNTATSPCTSHFEAGVLVYFMM